MIATPTIATNLPGSLLNDRFHRGNIFQTAFLPLFVAIPYLIQ